jgi:hypothetical protein
MDRKEARIASLGSEFGLRKFTGSRVEMGNVDSLTAIFSVRVSAEIDKEILPSDCVCVLLVKRLININFDDFIGPSRRLTRIFLSLSPPSLQTRLYNYIWVHLAYQLCIMCQTCL